jgi:hypothetical protein
VAVGDAVTVGVIGGSAHAHNLTAGVSSITIITLTNSPINAMDAIRNHRRKPLSLVILTPIVVYLPFRIMTIIWRILFQQWRWESV